MMRRKHDGTLVMGSRSASLYVHGFVYYLIYDTRRKDQRVSPNDVLRITWDSLENITRSEFDETSHRATVVTLHFARPFRYEASLFHTNSVFLALSTRNATVGRILAERTEQREARLLPLAMGLHLRLGSSSVLLQLMRDDILRLIGALL
jgi:hypothetical protein